MGEVKGCLQLQKRTLGVIGVLASALFFALATVLAKIVTRDEGALGIHVTMARFLVGFIVMIPWALKNREMVKMKSPFWVLTRVVTNLAAALLFFTSIQYAMISTASLLNMTYPVIVFALSPFVVRERIPLYQYAILVVTLIGVCLVIAPPGEGGVILSDEATLGNTLAFISAIAAGIAIIALRMARRTDGSGTIVFYIMAIGLVVNFFLVLGTEIPSGTGLWIVFAAGALGAMGQYALTVGMGYVNASTGALLSTARIGFAFLFGIVLFGEHFSTAGIIGSICIVAGLLTVSVVGSR